MCKTLFRSQGLLLEQLGYCFMWTAGSLLTWSNMNISANHRLVFERLFETILFQKHLSWRHNQVLLFSSCPPLESSGNECCLPPQLLQCSLWAGRVPWRRLSTPRTDTGSSLHTTQGCLLWSPTIFSPSPPSATIWCPTYRSWTYNWVSLQNFKTKHYHETPHCLSFSNWSFLISIW